MASELIMYQTEDGSTKLEVVLENETVWLSQAQMAELFQRERSVITKHIGNVFEENELDEKSNVQILHVTSSDRPIKLYSLDVVISVGYRVKSLRGTQFRIWATERLKEYIVKGFTMNDELLKKAGGGDYFRELLDRIRDIRSSEKVFYRQVLDIYATSVDYDPKTEATQLFFQTVQNKMHFAAHGKTAPELIFNRADAEAPFMGMTTFKEKRPTKAEALVAKNYLSQEELAILNRIVSAYLDFAELQAMRRIPMYMKDWIARLNDFIKMTGSELLENAGTISHQMAVEKASVEYERYRKMHEEDLTQVERDYLKSLKQAQRRLEGKK